MFCPISFNFESNIIYGTPSVKMSNWLDDHHSFSLDHHTQRQLDHERNHSNHLMLRLRMCRIGKNSQPIVQSSIHSRLLQCTLNTAYIFTFVTHQHSYHRTKNMGWTFTFVKGVPHTNAGIQALNIDGKLMDHHYTITESINNYFLTIADN
jgi:hypothetical protein